MNTDLPYKVLRIDAQARELRARFANSVDAVTWLMRMVELECNTSEWQVVTGTTGMVVMHVRWFDGTATHIEADDA